MSAKKLVADEMRVICLDQNATFELIAEYMIENSEDFFELQDMTDVVFQMRWCNDSQQFICVAANKKNKNEIDLSTLANKVGPTVKSIFSPNRYVSIKASNSQKNMMK